MDNSKKNENYLGGIINTFIYLGIGMVIALLFSESILFLFKNPNKNICLIIKTFFSNIIIIAVALKRTKRNIKDILLTKFHSSYKLLYISLIMIIGLLFFRHYIGEILINNFAIFKLSKGNLLNSFNDFNLTEIFLILINAPILEEILFRGIVLDGISKIHSAKISITVSSLLFALSHGNLIQSISTFMMGLFLGYIYINTKSIQLCIVSHFLNNLLAITISLIDGQLGLFSSKIFDYLFLIFGILIFIIGIRLFKVEIAKKSSEQIDLNNI